MTFLILTIYSLACFRLATLFGEEKGPYFLFSKLRSFVKREAKVNKPLRKSGLQVGISCIKCESLWHAAPIAIYAVFKPMLPGWFNSGCDAVLLGLALSAAAILMNRIPEKK